MIAIGGPNPRLTTLTVDDVAVARLATEHLLALGHREIAHIGASPEFDIDFHIPTQRRQGFEQALADAGIPSARRCSSPPTSRSRAASAPRSSCSGSPGGRPTAIFAASDEMAIGALLAARELGYRVPEDLSVIGIDGHELGEFFRLTTVDQFPLGQGERAADAILEALEPRRRRRPAAPARRAAVRAHRARLDRPPPRLTPARARRFGASPARSADARAAPRARSWRRTGGRPARRG